MRRSMEQFCSTPAGSVCSTIPDKLLGRLPAALRHRHRMRATLAGRSASATAAEQVHFQFSRRLLLSPSTRHRHTLRALGADAGASFPHDQSPSPPSSSSSAKPPRRRSHSPRSIFKTALLELQRFSALTGRFLPMVTLFFLLAFVNTILDSLKDTLVITAVGGGAQVIPYLTVYAVLPSSLIFLFAYSTASQHLSRATLFNAIIAVFCAFFCLFAFFLHPNHEVLHPNLDDLSKALPNGMQGLVGMVRNWTFTLFFCMSELWGDVCLGLLFWGLANDTTSLSDAHTLYPLFGLGANMAQALGGMVLKRFSSGSGESFGSQIQSMMVVVLGFSVAAVALHTRIEQGEQAKREAAAEAQKERAARVKRQQEQMWAAAAAAAAANGGGGGSPPQAAAAAAAQPGKEKTSLKEIFSALAVSVPIQCLAVMSLAQGLCSSLMEFAWKGYIKVLFDTPAEFTAFLGDVSTWQGVVTGLLMILSPAMFARMGWKGVAAATPQILFVGGIGFFGACMLYQYILAGSMASASASVMLSVLVYGGAGLYVFSKSAKFSLFRPAEEMVYISLDEEGRTKGKAAIDVVGSQAGKSGGSILQQVLLLGSGGSIAGSLPSMFAVYMLMTHGWLRAVSQLSEHNPRYGYEESVHPTLTQTTSGEDEAPVQEGGRDVSGEVQGGGGMGQGVQVQQ